MAVTLDTTSTYQITQNSGVSMSYRTKSLQFGDGYEHTQIDGLNYEQESWSMDFDLQLITTALTLEAILLNSVNGTANILSWTPPGESTTKYWRASNISRKPAGGLMWKVTCTLTRCFPI